MARGDLAGIADYIASDNPAAATRTMARIRHAADNLGLFPRLGRLGTVPRTYELHVRGLPYIVVYRIADAPEPTVIILGVFHGARRR